MKKTRLLALLLALVMVVALFAACGDVEPEETTTEATTTEATTTEATTTEPEAVDVSGMNFDFVVTDVTRYWSGDLVETQRGQELKASIGEVEDRLGCTINFTDGVDIRDLEWISTQALSGTHVYDSISCLQTVWIPAALNNYLWEIDILGAEYGLDIYNEDFCIQTSLDMTKLGDHCYALDFTGRYYRLSLGHFYAFNGDLTNAAGTPSADIYQAIRDFEWDYEMFLDISSRITDDTDSDGQYDVWGVALDCDGNEAWSNATGPIVLKDGKWTANLDDPQLLPALQFMYDLSGNDMTIPVIGGTVGRGDRRTNFYSGLCGFAGLYGGNISADQTGTCSFDLGVAPIPHGPNAESYCMNIVDCIWSVVLKTNPHIEATCRVLNEVGYVLTDYEGYVDDMLTNLNYSEECMEVINEYLVPNGKMNIAKCSENMYQITRKQFYSDIYTLEKTPSQAAEHYKPLVQAELDLIFGY